MNLPLNIDWQQILLHAFNFAILALGLYLLLYGPVKKYMAQRREHYESMDVAARNKLDKADELERSYAVRRQELETDLNEQRAAAELEAEQSARRIIQEAEREARELIAAARLNAAQEQERMIESSREEITQLAAETVDEMLAKSDSDTLDEFLVIVQKEV